jgi:signal transduction histidine kinase
VLAARLDQEAALRLAVTDGAAGPMAGYREQLISVISHEVRTPVTTIQGCVEVLLDEPGIIASEYIWFAEAISRNTARLCRTADHLLHAASAGETVPHRRRPQVDLVQLVATHLAGHGRHIDLIAPTAPVQIDADPQLLGRAIDNLLANAVAFSASDTPVTVTVVAHPEPAVLAPTGELASPPRNYRTSGPRSSAVRTPAPMRCQA